jgi:acetolactate synthase I/II/III large subunit
MLGEAKRPLIYAGGGVINGERVGRALRASRPRSASRRHDADGHRRVDTTHPLSLHMLGMHGAAFANYAVDDCDFLIAVGARFDDRVAGVPAKFAPNAKHIAHLDIDASEIGKVKRVRLVHVGLLRERSCARRAYGRRQRSRATSAWHAH